jgi:hypothetical protein
MGFAQNRKGETNPVWERDSVAKRPLKRLSFVAADEKAKLAWRPGSSRLNPEFYLFGGLGKNNQLRQVWVHAQPAVGRAGGQLRCARLSWRAPGHDPLQVLDAYHIRGGPRGGGVPDHRLGAPSAFARGGGALRSGVLGGLSPQPMCPPHPLREIACSTRSGGTHADHESVAEQVAEMIRRS